MGMLMYLVVVSVTVLLDVIKIAAMPNLDTMTPGAAFGAVIYFFIFVLKFAIVGAIYLYQRTPPPPPSPSRRCPTARAGATTRSPSERAAERTSEMPRSGKGPWGWVAVVGTLRGIGAKTTLDRVYRCV